MYRSKYLKGDTTRRDTRDIKREYDNNSNNSQLLTTLLLVYLKNIFS